MEDKYKFYKGMWWKYLPPSDVTMGIVNTVYGPKWRISEYEDDSMCCVFILSAVTYSLDQAYECIANDENYQYYKRENNGE